MEPALSTTSTAGNAIGKLTYTISELSRATGLGRTFLYARISSGDLVRIKAGSRTLVTAESAEAFIHRLIEAEKGE